MLFPALKVKDFRIILATLSLSMVGDAALQVVFGIALVDLTGSYTAAGLGYVGIALPALLAPAGGVIVDRVRRQPFLICLFIVTALLVLTLVFVNSTEDVWIIYAVTVVCGLCHFLKDAALLGLLKGMLSEYLLGSANSLIQTIFQSMRLVGPVVGAGLYGLGGLKTVAVFNAITFIPLVLALLLMHINEPEAPLDESTGHLTSAFLGASHLWRDRPLRNMTAALAGSLLFMGIPTTNIYALVRDGLHRPISFVAILISVQGVGAVLGGLVCNFIVSRWSITRTMCIGLALFATGQLGLIIPSLPFTMGCMMVSYCGLTWLFVASATQLQLRTPSESMGRVSTAFDVITSTPQAISIAGGALLIALVDFKAMQVVIAAGVFITATLLFIFPGLSPGTQNDKRSAPDTAEATDASL
ncbi:MFS transporter [Streptomyces sp. NPDC048643]|uniref:MFS transporter n=1 Tax=Streptomyces sp. NPDC048643 TaxID=3155637 RepID=UPI00342BAD62